jgi:hypothetical protein
MPLRAGSTELIDDILGGMFCAFEPPEDAVGLVPLFARPVR